jgi:hypothetical protein
MIKDDEAAIKKAEQFCDKHGIRPGFKFMDPKDGLTAVPNKLDAACPCSALVPSGEGFWIAKLKQIWCKNCWAQHEAKANPAEPVRVKARIIWNSRLKRAMVRPADSLGQVQYEAFSQACKDGGCEYSADLGYNGPLGIVPELVRLLERADLRTEVSNELANALLERADEIKSSVASAEVRVVASGLRGKKLKDYQKRGVEFLAARTSALIADDPGLGKTCQILKSIPPQGRVLVISPKIVTGAIIKGKAIGGWCDEAATWRPDLKVTIIPDRQSFRWPEPGEIVLVNYQLLPVAPAEIADLAAKASKKRRKALEKGEKLDPAAIKAEDAKIEEKRSRVCPEPPPGVIVVIDEAHACANPNSQQTIRTRHCATRARVNGGRSYAVTATPTKNNPKELWCVLEVIGAAQLAFGSFQNYAQLHDYAPKNVAKDRVTYEFGEASPEVAERLKRVMLRRKKRDVLAELPPLSIRRLLVDVDRETVKACDAALKELEKAGLDIEKAMEIVDEARSGFDFTMISKALAALAQLKLPHALERAAEYERVGTPCVFFATHRSITDALGKRDGWGMLVGGNESTIHLGGKQISMKSTEVAKNFWEGRIDKATATIQHAGVGLNGLQRASDLVLVEKAWNPAMNTQAIGRIERLGQKNPMMVTDMVADHPLDIRMSEVLENKIELYAATVDAAAVAPEDLNKREDAAGELREAAEKRAQQRRPS